MTKDEAKQRVLEFLNADAPDEDHIVAIDDTMTLEKEYGWIFQYDSKKSMETNEPGYALVGNAPVVFEKATGKMTFLDGPIEGSFEERVKKFELENGLTKHS